MLIVKSVNFARRNKLTTKKLKRMKRISCISFLMLCATFMAVAQKNITIKGNVKFMEPGFKVVVFERSGTTRNVLAEAVVDELTHNYEITMPVTKQKMAVVDCGGWQSVNVWLCEDENLGIDFRGLDTARVKIKNPPYVYIKGGKNNDLMNIVNFESYRNYQSMIAISQAAYRAQFADDANKQTLTSTLYTYNGENSDAWMKYLIEHFADRPSVMVPIGAFSYESNKDMIEEAFKTLVAADAKNQVLVDDYKTEQEERRIRRERMKIGAPAPLFDFENTKGKTVNLQKLLGKKILVIDFWASWCGPCRAEIPLMKPIYEEYKNKGVEFLSVSIDAKRDAWVKAMNEEKMPWQMGWTPDAGKEVMDLYQFGGIPFILVIDQNGKIYRKSVRGEGIKKAIQDCLDGVPAEAPKPSKGISMGMMMM